eukprot:1341838-Amphidinium_carterae.1
MGGCVQRRREQTELSIEVGFREVLVSSTSLKAIKTLCSLCMSLGVSPLGKPLKLALWDICRAHLYGDAQRDLYVELPSEDSHRSDDVEPMCGLLLRTM